MKCALVLIVGGALYTRIIVFCSLLLLLMSSLACALRLTVVGVGHSSPWSSPLIVLRTFHPQILLLKRERNVLEIFIEG